jgi:hypothetical protein
MIHKECIYVDHRLQTIKDNNAWWNLYDDNDDRLLQRNTYLCCKIISMNHVNHLYNYKEHSEIAKRNDDNDQDNKLWLTKNSLPKAGNGFVESVSSGTSSIDRLINHSSDKNIQRVIDFRRRVPCGTRLLII